MKLRRFEDEDGAVAVVVATSLVVLVLLLAFVIDLGLARVDRMVNQSASDLAATAGVLALDPGNPDRYEAACEAAFDYFVANTPGLDASAATTDCSPFQAPFNCDTYVPVGGLSVDFDMPPYLLTITMPVPDDHGSMVGQPLNPEVDGDDPCDRMNVRVTRDRGYAFAQVAGFSGTRPVADAVALRTQAGESEEFASLVVLDRTRCDALLASGQGLVDVQSFTDPGTGEVYEGFIAVDSDGLGPNCDPVQQVPGGSNSGKAVEVQNSVSGCSGPCGVQATGEIFIHAVRTGGAAFDECDLDQGTGRSCLGKPVLLTPRPIGGRRVTRAPIDHRYNCHPSGYPAPTFYPVSASYPSAPMPAAPQYPVEPIDPCDDGSPEPHIDRLIAAYGGMGTPAGFRVFPTDASLPPGTTCTIGPSTVITVTAGTQWYIDCAQLKVSGTLRFEDVDAVILRGQPNINQASLDLGSNGAVFEVNSGAAIDDAVFYIRQGGIARAGGAALLLNRTLLYMHEGFLATVGNAAATASLRLESPYGPQDDPVCAGYVGAPPAQCFEDLAVWSNGWRTRNPGPTLEYTSHTLKGQGSLDIRGAVFTPNAGRGSSYFELNGQGLNELFEAQFIAHRINLSGQGTVRMKPNPETNTGFPLTGGGLIR